MMMQAHKHHVARIAITACLALLLYISGAMLAPTAQAVRVCGPMTSQAEDTSTRSSSVGVQACMEVVINSKPTRTIRVQPTIVWKNVLNAPLAIYAVDFNSISISASFATPTGTPTLPPWSQLPLAQVNAADSITMSSTNAYTSSAAGTYYMTARTTYDVKDDGRPPVTLYSNMAYTVT